MADLARRRAAIEFSADRLLLPAKTRAVLL
jgi:hypothetical protein